MDCEPNCLTDMNSYTHFIKRTRRIVMEKTMDKIIALAKARGFVYPGSEIYGGLANTWDWKPVRRFFCMQKYVVKRDALDRGTPKRGSLYRSGPRS